MARALRREGLSIRDIEQHLGVSRSSVSLWVRDIELTPEQHARLDQRNAARGRQLYGNVVWAAECLHRRRWWQAEGRLAARAGDATHAAGCMLFWAEGSKARNMVQLANADPELIRVFVAFLRDYFDVPDEKFRIACNLFADHLEKQHEIEQFWLDLTRLPPSCMTKTMVNVYSKHSQKKRQNKLPYGTCRVSVHDTRIAQHLYGAIQEYGGFERPEWLD